MAKIYLLLAGQVLSVKNSQKRFLPGVNQLRGKNVGDVNYDVDAINEAIMKCLYNENFRQQCHRNPNSYGTGGVGRKIVDVLATIEIDLKLLQKKMTY